MPAAPLRRFGLLLVASVAAAFAVCLPPGEEGVRGSLLGSVQQVAASGLAQWIEQSRASAAAGSQGIPRHIRAQLEPYYDRQVLDTVRYRVGDAGQFSAATALLLNPDVNAVTLVDLIAFRREEDARHNVALWAHELTHVQQYRQWGVQGFAVRYARDHSAVEAPAYAMQTRVARALRGLPTVAAGKP
ncbi:MAG TPA: DUF4157 domain-containing protein [Pseudomonas sp.]|nr:DUF4157 domain-containing protein [Pseudomonas sp.]